MGKKNPSMAVEIIQPSITIGIFILLLNLTSCQCCACSHCIVLIRAAGNAGSWKRKTGPRVRVPINMQCLSGHVSGQRWKNRTAHKCAQEIGTASHVGGACLKGDTQGRRARSGPHILPLLWRLHYQQWLKYIIDLLPTHLLEFYAHCCLYLYHCWPEDLLFYVTSKPSDRHL